MTRTLIENSDLPLAISWERLRQSYYAKHGNHEKSQECADTADWLQARLNKVLEDHINVA